MNKHLLERVTEALPPGSVVKFDPGTDDHVTLSLGQVNQLIDFEPERGFPAESLEDALRAFRRPFAPAAVKWKVQAVANEWALVVPYIDARLVIERLNLVWPWWQPDFDGPKGERACTITLFNLDDGVVAVTRTDAGEGSFLKAANSDALKRAAVQWGIGVSIYALSKVEIKGGSNGNNEPAPVEGESAQWWHGKPSVTWKTRGAGDKAKLTGEITAAGRARLHSFYERWLAERGERDFGPRLDHGDVEDSIGDVAEERQEAPEDAPAARPVLVDVEADQLRQEAREAYKAVVKVPAKRKDLPPARFKQLVEDASTSHEDLRALVAELKGMVE